MMNLFNKQAFSKMQSASLQFAQKNRFLPTPIYSQSFRNSANMIGARISTNANYFVVLDDQQGERVPTLQFKTDGPSITLDGGKSLREIEQGMRRKSMISKQAEFYSPDGTRYAKSCEIQEIMNFPFFRVRIDELKEYHVHNSHAIRRDIQSID